MPKKEKGANQSKYDEIKAYYDSTYKNLKQKTEKAAQDCQGKDKAQVSEQLVNLKKQQSDLQSKYRSLTNQYRKNIKSSGQMPYQKKNLNYEGFCNTLNRKDTDSLVLKAAFTAFVNAGSEEDTAVLDVIRKTSNSIVQNMALAKAGLVFAKNNNKIGKDVTGYLEQYLTEREKDMDIIALIQGTEYALHLSEKASGSLNPKTTINGTATKSKKNLNTINEIIDKNDNGNRINVIQSSNSNRKKADEIKITKEDLENLFVLASQLLVYKNAVVDMYKKNQVEAELAKFAKLETEDERLRYYMTWALSFAKIWEYPSESVVAQIPGHIRTCGNINEVRRYLIEYQDQMDLRARIILFERIRALKKVETLKQQNENNQLPKEENYARKVYAVSKGNVKMTVPLRRLQTSGAGCWSVGIKLMLESHGIQVEQEDIRAYRPDYPKKKRLNKGFLKTVDSDYKKDDIKSITEYADSAIAFAPDMMLRSFEIKNPTEAQKYVGIGRKVDVKKYYAEAISYTKKRLRQILNEEKCTISFTNGSHYYTITDISDDEKGTLTCLDSQTHKIERDITVKGLVEDMLSGRYLYGKGNLQFAWLSKIELAENGKDFLNVPSNHLSMNSDGTLNLPPEEIMEDAECDVFPFQDTGLRLRVLGGKDISPYDRLTDSPLMKNDLLVSEQAYLPRKLNANTLIRDMKARPKEKTQALIAQRERLLGAGKKGPRVYGPGESLEERKKVIAEIQQLNSKLDVILDFKECNNLFNIPKKEYRDNNNKIFLWNEEGAVLAFRLQKSFNALKTLMEYLKDYDIDSYQRSDWEKLLKNTEATYRELMARLDKKENGFPQDMNVPETYTLKGYFKSEKDILDAVTLLSSISDKIDVRKLGSRRFDAKVSSTKNDPYNPSMISKYAENISVFADVRNKGNIFKEYSINKEFKEEVDYCLKMPTNNSSILFTFYTKCPQNSSQKTYMEYCLSVNHKMKDTSYKAKRGKELPPTFKDVDLKVLQNNNNKINAINAVRKEIQTIPGNTIAQKRQQQYKQFVLDMQIQEEGRSLTQELYAVQELTNKLNSYLKPGKNLKLISYEGLQALYKEYLNVQKMLESNKLLTMDNIIYDKFRLVMGKDIQIIRKTLENKKQTLDTDQNRKKPLIDMVRILEENRTRTVVLDPNKREIAEGGAQNRRIRIDIQGENGEKIDGYFTQKEEPFDFKEELNKAYSELGNGNPFVIEFLKYALPNIDKMKVPSPVREYQMQLSEKCILSEIHTKFDNPDDYVAEFRKKMEETFERYVKANSIQNNHERYSVIENAAKSFVKDVDSVDRLISGIKKLKNITTKNQCRTEIGINNNSRVNKRNSAMSMVAELIGVDSVLCKSENMRLMESAGRTISVKGTFMESAGFKSIFDATVDDPNLAGFTLTELEHSPKFIEAVANLQILDYICGNTDRHVGNLSLIPGMVTLEDGSRVMKLVDIQGFDNDNCLGAKSLKSIEYLHNFYSLKDCRIIPKKTADYIKKLDAEVFNAMLVGYDLSVEEIHRAQLRLTEVKEAIIRGEEFYRTNHSAPVGDEELKIVDSDEMKELSFSGQLAKGNNLFSKIKRVFEKPNRAVDLMHEKHLYSATDAFYRVHSGQKKLSDWKKDLPDKNLAVYNTMQSEVEKMQKAYDLIPNKKLEITSPNSNETIANRDFENAYKASVEAVKAAEKYVAYLKEMKDTANMENKKEYLKRNSDLAIGERYYKELIQIRDGYKILAEYPSKFDKLKELRNKKIVPEKVQVIEPQIQPQIQEIEVPQIHEIMVPKNQINLNPDNIQNGNPDPLRKPEDNIINDPNAIPKQEKIIVPNPVKPEDNIINESNLNPTGEKTNEPKVDEPKNDEPKIENKDEIKVDNTADNKDEIKVDNTAENKNEIKVDNTAEIKPEMQPVVITNTQPIIEPEIKPEDTNEIKSEGTKEIKPEINPEIVGAPKTENETENTDKKGSEAGIDNKGGELPKVEMENKGEELPKVESENKGEGLPKAESENKGEGLPKVEIENKGEELPKVESENKGEGLPKVESDHKAENDLEIKPEKETEIKPEESNLNPPTINVLNPPTSIVLGQFKKPEVQPVVQPEVQPVPTQPVVQPVPTQQIPPVQPVVQTVPEQQIPPVQPNPMQPVLDTAQMVPPVGQPMIQTQSRMVPPTSNVLNPPTSVVLEEPMNPAVPTQQIPPVQPENPQGVPTDQTASPSIQTQLLGVPTDQTAPPSIRTQLLGEPVNPTIDQTQPQMEPPQSVVTTANEIGTGTENNEEKPSTEGNEKPSTNVTSTQKNEITTESDLRSYSEYEIPVTDTGEDDDEQEIDDDELERITLFNKIPEDFRRKAIQAKSYDEAINRIYYALYEYSTELNTDGRISQLKDDEEYLLGIEYDGGPEYRRMTRALMKCYQDTRYSLEEGHKKLEEVCAVKYEDIIKDLTELEEASKAYYDSHFGLFGYHWNKYGKVRLRLSGEMSAKASQMRGALNRIVRQLDDDVKQMNREELSTYIKALKNDSKYEYKTVDGLIISFDEQYRIAGEQLGALDNFKEYVPAIGSKFEYDKKLDDYLEDGTAGNSLDLYKRAEIYCSFVEVRSIITNQNLTLAEVSTQSKAFTKKNIAGKAKALSSNPIFEGVQRVHFRHNNYSGLEAWEAIEKKAEDLGKQIKEEAEKNYGVDDNAMVAYIISEYSENSKNEERTEINTNTTVSNPADARENMYAAAAKVFTAKILTSPVGKNLLLMMAVDGNMEKVNDLEESVKQYFLRKKTFDSDLTGSVTEKIQDTMKSGTILTTLLKNYKKTRNPQPNFNAYEQGIDFLQMEGDHQRKQEGKNRKLQEKLEAERRKNQRIAKENQKSEMIRNSRIRMTKLNKELQKREKSYTDKKKALFLKHKEMPKEEEEAYNKYKQDTNMELDRLEFQTEGKDINDPLNQVLLKIKQEGRRIQNAFSKVNKNASEEEKKKLVAQNNVLSGLKNQLKQGKISPEEAVQAYNAKYPDNKMTIEYSEEYPKPIEIRNEEQEVDLLNADTNLNTSNLIENHMNDSKLGEIDTRTNPQNPNPENGGQGNPSLNEAGSQKGGKGKPAPGFHG